MQISLSEHFNYKILLRFTIPSIIMMMFSSLYSVIDDGLFVSNFVGKEAFVALNIMAPIMTVFGAIGSMIGSGANALISKTLGEKQDKKAGEYFTQIVIFSIAISILVTIIGLIGLEPFCLAMGAEDKVLEYCLTYGRIIFPLTIIFLFQWLFQNLLITSEKPRLAMIITICSGVSNIFFDTLLIVILKWGIVGAVLATVSGSLVSMLISLSYFLFGKDKKFGFTKIEFDLKIAGQVCYNGLSELINNLSMSVSSALFNYQLMNIAGNDGVAAYGVIMYICYVFSSAFTGYSMGIAPVVGYNYGAENQEELKNVLKMSFRVVAVLGFILLGLSEATAVPFSKVFVSYDQDLLNMTVHGLRLFSPAFLVMGFNIFGISFFTALNNGKIAGFMSFVRTFVLQVLALLILPNFLGLNGIWLASLVAESMMLIVTFTSLKKMDKKYHYYSYKNELAFSTNRK